MKIQAWTFLISRNQSIDYKTVVAPDFISEAKIRSLFLKISDDDFAENGEIAIREVLGSEVGNFTIIFRSVKARSKDIGETENKVLKDPFGREIYWMEGLVFKKSRKEIQYKTGKSHLDQAHRELQDNYREFWHEDRLSVSHEIDLLEVTSKPDNKFRVLDPLVITPKHQLPEKQELEKHNYSSKKTEKNKTNLLRVILIAITVLSLIGVLGFWWKSQSTNICLYMTQEVKIVFSPLSSKNFFGIDGLKKLKKEHTTAWILLNGSLDVEKTLADQIRGEVDKQKGKVASGTTITLVPDENNALKLNIKNHPIDLMLVLLQNNKVTGGTLDATIIEPISQNESSCR